MVTATGIAVRREASPIIKSRLPKVSVAPARYAVRVGNARRNTLVISAAAVIAGD